MSVEGNGRASSAPGTRASAGSTPAWPSWARDWSSWTSPGHWSESLVDEGIAASWLAAPIVGEPDQDARAVLDGARGGRRAPDAVLTFWENSIDVCARVATALGLPDQPGRRRSTPRAARSARASSRPSCGLPTPARRRVRSLDELFAASPYVGFPAVVKPEFGASAMGCVRVDTPRAAARRLLARAQRRSPRDTTASSATGNDLLVEEYLDGVEFDVDLVMHDGECVFSSVSQNWPTAEPSFQETGLHCPPDHDRKAVSRAGRPVRADGAGASGCTAACCTSRGRRPAGGRASSRSTPAWAAAGSTSTCGRVGRRPDRGPPAQLLDLPPSAHPEPQAAVPRSSTGSLRARDGSAGRAADRRRPREGRRGPSIVDVDAEVGEEVDGPEAVFAHAAGRGVGVRQGPQAARAASIEVQRVPARVEGVLASHLSTGSRLRPGVAVTSPLDPIESAARQLVRGVVDPGDEPDRDGEPDAVDGGERRVASAGSERSRGGAGGRRRTRRAPGSRC